MLCAQSLQALVYDILDECHRSEVFRQSSKHWFTTSLMRANCFGLISAGTTEEPKLSRSEVFKLWFTTSLISQMSEVFRQSSKHWFTTSLISQMSDVFRQTSKHWFTTSLISQMSEVFRQTSKLWFTTFLLQGRRVPVREAWGEVSMLLP